MLEKLPPEIEINHKKLIPELLGTNEDGCLLIDGTLYLTIWRIIGHTHGRIPWKKWKK